MGRVKNLFSAYFLQVLNIVAEYHSWLTFILAGFGWGWSGGSGRVCIFHVTDGSDREAGGSGRVQHNGPADNSDVDGLWFSF